MAYRWNSDYWCTIDLLHGCWWLSAYATYNCSFQYFLYSGAYNYWLRDSYYRVLAPLRVTPLLSNYIKIIQLLVELEQNITAQSTYSTGKWLSAKMHNAVAQTINAQSSYRTNGLWLIAWPQGPTYCANQTVTNCVSGLPLEFRLLMHYRLIAWLLMTECVRDLQLFFPVWLSAI